jgi:thiol-disulfide isomerase/thioredoxin
MLSLNIKKVIILASIVIIWRHSLAQVSDNQTKTDLIKKFYDSATLLEKQRIFDIITKKYPQTDPKNLDVKFDDFRYILSINYLETGDTVRFSENIAMIKDKFLLSQNLNNIAQHWVKVKPLLAAGLKMSLLSLSINDSLQRIPKLSRPANLPLKEWKKMLMDQKIKFTTTYAYGLYSSGNIEKALSYMEPIFNKKSESDFQFLEYYSLVLGNSGNAKKSDKIIIDLWSKGYASSDMDVQFKKNYVSLNGSENDFDKYKLQVNDKIKQTQILRMTEKSLDIQAPQFKLISAQNDTLSLKSFEGKVLVIDFWATWCVPCIEMFPTMQKLVDKYKTNDSVKFIFINTWENDNNYHDLVKKFIRSSGYNFTFLIDERNANSKQKKISDQFLINSLPTKIFIDRHGKIKFIEEGFSGSSESLFNEASTRIDFLLNQKN